MSNRLKKYEYSGPVFKFDKLFSNNWKGSTYASSRERAKSNLSFQFKKEHNLTTNTKITLPYSVIEV